MDNCDSLISLVYRHQAAARKPIFRSNSVPPPFFKCLTLVCASAIASCVNGLPLVTSKSSDEEKENFLAWVEWLPVTSQTHGQTDKCKISIMMAVFKGGRGVLWFPPSLNKTLNYYMYPKARILCAMYNVHVASTAICIHFNSIHTNSKLRVKLGLKPLDVGGSKSVSKESEQGGSEETGQGEVSGEGLVHA